MVAARAQPVEEGDRESHGEEQRRTRRVGLHEHARRIHPDGGRDVRDRRAIDREIDRTVGSGFRRGVAAEAGGAAPAYGRRRAATDDTSAACLAPARGAVLAGLSPATESGTVGPWPARGIGLSGTTSATAAAGAIAGATVVLSRGVITDWKTALIAVAALGFVLRFKNREPILVLAAATAGILLHGV